MLYQLLVFFFFQAEDGIRDSSVTGVQTCALPISHRIGRSELGARAARSHTAALTGADARYDAIFAQYGVIRVQDYDELLEVAHLLAHTPKPGVPGIAVVSHSGGISSLTADMCGQAGLDLPPLGEEARAAINGILKGFGWVANPAHWTGFPNSEAIAQGVGLGRPTLSESESKQLLAAWGVGSAREHRANSAEAAVEAAEQLGFPVALKVESPDIPHKTEAGVVRLNLGDAAQVRTAYAEILASAKAYAPQARISGVSVQEMVGEGVEVIIGVSCDPQLGPVLLFGSGGVLVEVHNDVALRRCPITRSEAQAMIAEVKGARLLRGFRGRPAADLAALEDTLVRVSYLAMHLEGHLAELDINPLMVLPSGQGVKAVDALVVFRGT